METNDQKKQLVESTIPTIVPTTRGLGFVRSVKDYIWAEETNIHTDLVNGTYDPQNSSYPHKLNTAIQILASTKKDTQLADILTACREKYPQKIELGNAQTFMAHELLVEENKNKQALLKEAITTKDKEFIAKENDLLKDLQKSTSENVAIIKSCLDEYIKNRDAFVTEECNEIRRLKKGLVILHHLNKTVVLEGGYCSDEEKDENNVETSYNDKYLLKKIAINFQMNDTVTKTENLLLRLAQLEQELKDIQPLVYSKI
jgi:hypothetical protein